MMPKPGIGIACNNSPFSRFAASFSSSWSSPHEERSNCSLPQSLLLLLLLLLDELFEFEFFSVVELFLVLELELEAELELEVELCLLPDLSFCFLKRFCKPDNGSVPEELEHSEAAGRARRLLAFRAGISGLSSLPVVDHI